MNKFLLNFCFLFLSFSASLAQNLQWVKSIGGVNDDFGYSITTDASGNVYTTGRFENIVDFDAGVGTYTLASAGGADVFVSKYNASGNFLWARSFGSYGDDEGRSIVIDALGNIHIIGNFCQTVDFDPGPGTYTLSSPANFDAFINKLDANGNFVWARQIGGSNWDNGFSISVDALGNVLTTGYFTGSADFDPGPATYTLVSAANSSDAFISKVDVNGNFVFAKQFSMSSGKSIYTDASGNVYTTGSFGGLNIDFDPGPGTYTFSGSGTFISKLDAGGNFVWAKQLGGSGGSCLKIDSQGDIYTSGGLVSNVATDFDPGPGTYTLIGAGAFISKLDAGGNFIWAKQIDGIANALSIDNNDNLYIAGNSNTNIDLDPGPGTYTLPVWGGADVFVIRLDANGTFVGGIKLGGNGDDFGYGINVDTFGAIYTTGFFSETADFDPGPGVFNITSSPTGYHDIFIHKMSTIVGLRENDIENTITLYPNPTNGYITYLNKNNGNYTYSISDVTGKIIQRGRFNESSDELNLNTYDKGLYFITISNKEYQQTKTIIVR